MVGQRTSILASNLSILIFSSILDPLEKNTLNLWNKVFKVDGRKTLGKGFSVMGLFAPARLFVCLSV